MSVLPKELARAFRSLARDPGSAAVAVIVLALGIGLSGFMFTFIYGTYVRGLDIADPDRVVAINETRVEENQLRRLTPLLDFVDWRERQTMFQGLLAFRAGQTLNISGTETPIRLLGARVTANAFSLLGVPPALGRVFVEGDDRPGAPALLVLSHQAWRDHFGSDPTVVGRQLQVHGEPGTIVGVMPEGFEWPGNTEAWVPIRDDPMAAPRGSGLAVSVWGRLRDGVTVDLAAQEMQGIARQLAEEYPEVNEGVGTSVVSTVKYYMSSQLNGLFMTMLSAVVLVLLVACFNVGGLLLARATARTREAAIRTALGARAWRVALPFATEAFALSLLGAALGVGIAVVTASWFDQATAEFRPWFMLYDVEWRTILFIVALTAATALLASVAPALHLLRTNVNAVLKDESRGSSGRRAGRLIRLLVTAEVALSCVLLVGAVLMAGSMAKLGTMTYPFETERVMTARIGLNPSDYPRVEDRLQFWRDLRRELEAQPGIASAALGHTVPYGRGGSGPTPIPVSIDGADYGDLDERPPLSRVVVSPGFFETYRVDLSAGRDFRDADDQAAERVAIVNQPMVDRYFGGQNPIGRRFREGVSDTLPPVTVVGVVPDMHVQPPNRGNDEDYEPAAYYIPLAQSDQVFLTMAALARGDAAGPIAQDLRIAAARVDPTIPIYWVVTEKESIRRATGFVSIFGTVFLVFGLAALFIASVGLYGVLSFSVAMRTAEMGIRMTLGADAGRVISLVLRQGTRQVGLGLTLGVLGAFLAAPLISLIVYGIRPRDPLVFCGVVVLILGVGLLASFVPARRAASVDPIDALRAE